MLFTRRSLSIYNRLSFTPLVFSVMVIGLLQSCNSEKNLASLVYFNQQGDSALAKIVQSTEPVIQPGDRLSITINALNATSAAPYNLGSSASGASGTNSGYLVEEDGTIQLPQLGKIKIAGMQRKPLVDLLTQMVSKFVTDPVVTIQFINFKITVLGEVNKAGALTIPEGKVTLLEAIGLAGDLTYYSRRDNIIVIRERNGKREFGTVNLLSKNAFSSPYFVLEQNDVVYVQLTKGKAAATDQAFVRNLAIGTSIISVLSSLVFLIINVTR